MCKIYLSAAWARRSEMAAVAYKLRYQGHAVTSRWISEPQKTLQEASLMDLEDVRACSTFVRFSDESFFGKNKRVDRGLLSGGRLVETGYAIALGKRCVTIGGKQSVFDELVLNLPDVQSLYRFLSLEQAAA